MRAVYATFAREDSQRVFHPDCFVAFTTGLSRHSDILTYRIPRAGEGRLP